MTTQEYLDSWKTKEDMILCPVIDAVNALIDVYNDRGRLIMNQINNYNYFSPMPYADNLDIIYQALSVLDNFTVNRLLNQCVDYTVNGGDFSGLNAIPTFKIVYNGHNQLTPYIDILWDIFQKMKKIKWYNVNYIYTGDPTNVYNIYNSMHFVWTCRDTDNGIIEPVEDMLSRVKNKIPDIGCGSEFSTVYIAHYIRKDFGLYNGIEYDDYEIEIDWGDILFHKTSNFSADYYLLCNDTAYSPYDSDPVYQAGVYRKMYSSMLSDSAVSFRFGYDNSKDLPTPQEKEWYHNGALRKSNIGGFIFRIYFNTILHLDPMFIYKI